MMRRFIKRLPRSKKKLLYGLVLFLNDAVFLALAFFLSYYLRFYTTLFKFLESNPVYSINTHYVFYSVVFVVLNQIFFDVYRLYNRDQLYRGSGYYFRYTKNYNIFINLECI